ncbi:MAG: S26 family signal peptidase [Bacteroidales bacterium]
MRWLWLLLSGLACCLTALFTRQPLVLLALVPLIDLFITRKVRWPLIARQSGKNGKGWIGLLAWAILTTLIIRLFILDSQFVGQDYSRSEVQRGDRVLISKVHFGPRLPITPLHIPFTSNYLPFAREKRSYLERPSLPPLRLNGLRAIRRNELIAYNFPEGDSVIRGQEGSSYYALRRRALTAGELAAPLPAPEYRPLDRRAVEVSRCKGLPGDTIVIRQGRVYINGALEGSGQRISFNHLVEGRISDSLLNEISHRFGFSGMETTTYPGLGLLIPLRMDQQAELQQLLPAGARPVLLHPGQGDYNIFPNDYRFPWNRDHFGPVILPGKGDSVRLTPLNLPFYERIIRVYENNSLEQSGNEIRINGVSSNYYTFRQNYYFVLGDNRHHSRDSRHWGFLPEDHVTGKPILIWFSGRKEANKTTWILWKRILKVPE